MRAEIVLITIMLVCVCSARAFAAPQKQGDAGPLAATKESVSNGKSKTEEALQSKKRGDEYASHEDNKRAADEYVKALSLDATAFTIEERLRMAIVISWADRLEEASRILREILAEDPQNEEARVHLAKVLSWSDKLNEAQVEADTVLNQHPDDWEALLVKANVLRWRGDAGASIPLYERVLAEEESFDARVGLAYAYLDVGKKDKAKEIGKTLAPTSEAQQKEVVKLTEMFAAVSAQEQKQGDAGPLAATKESVSNGKSKTEEALQSKKRGDEYASHEDNKRAADEYVKALSLDATAFTIEERLRMAIVISWADRLEEASRILREILAEDPQNEEARVHLAKVLSWSDKLNEAQVEADTVLNQHPDDWEALLVKANVLRWRGDAGASIPLYERVLAEEESFDARVGLAYAYLDVGKKDKAKEIGKTLAPTSEAQRKEAAKLSEMLSSVSASHAGLQESYYRDSDSNTVKRSTLSYGFWAGNWETEFDYRLTDAKDPVRHEWAEDILITTHTHVGKFSTGVGAGISSTAGGTRNDLIGQANTDISMGWWAFGMNVSREELSDTAQLVQNWIKRTSETLSFSETESPRLTFSESYSYSSYSDCNDADDLRAGARYAFTLAPLKIATGYRFRYWDFRRQSGSGYFDPEDFISHQIFVSIYAEHEGLYAYLEPNTGYQSFKRYGVNTGNFFSGYTASAGLKIKKSISCEMSSEGGNYAGTTTGFNYYQVGLRLIVNF
jgi:thioredoxin-like negative regulator of GroEL